MAYTELFQRFKGQSCLAGKVLASGEILQNTTENQLTSKHKMLSQWVYASRFFCTYLLWA